MLFILFKKLHVRALTYPTPFSWSTLAIEKKSGRQPHVLLRGQSVPQRAVKLIGMATPPKLSVAQVVEMNMKISSKVSVVEALPFHPPLKNTGVRIKKESDHIRPHIATGLMLIVALIGGRHVGFKRTC